MTKFQREVLAYALAHDGIAQRNRRAVADALGSNLSSTSRCVRILIRDGYMNGPHRRAADDVWVYRATDVGREAYIKKGMVLTRKSMLNADRQLEIVEVVKGSHVHAVSLRTYRTRQKLLDRNASPERASEIRDITSRRYARQRIPWDHLDRFNVHERQ